MKISKQHLPRTSKKRTGRKMIPTYITIHSTGNSKSTAQNERDYLTNPINTNSTGWHYVVGDNIIIEAIPPTEIGYHAGDGRNGPGNTKSIGIEMVETGNRDKVIKNTIKLVKYLQDRFNITNDKVVRHYDWTGKNCPRILNKNGYWSEWIYFKTLLRKEDNKMTDKEIRKIIKEEIQGLNSKPSSWAKDDWEKAIEFGITDGSRPKGLATREEVISLIFRSIYFFN